MEHTRKDVQDKRVLNLAADISYADEKSIPRLLLQIQGSILSLTLNDNFFCFAVRLTNKSL